MTNRIADMSRDINVSVFLKGNDRYIFMFHDDQLEAVLLTMRRFARNPQLSLSEKNADEWGDEVIAMVPR